MRQRGHVELRSDHCRPTSNLLVCCITSETPRKLVLAASRHRAH